ncbi:Chromosome partition protein Smc [Limihaloglobus sulfuriphilus]|uniref:Chromosome partition protein Smc n=1 Tax=Limihaloglobus sulfuriphilus TaxID=1851148 RepID=A0A1Q2MDR7_9BACT|nr:chromosome segregation protein SMC [Limihaloglobus sulfuriphilus]AQQ70841.1 Chromosome partition protein Smc [Limihaloglobus sulfuriphilus]
MRLEKIILNGFKSFADKTEFKFDSSITAIVGPNGCGKSNVVDAVKWVLGEQKKKSLRSSQMTDVIFNGSANRKPSSMAEVSIVFSGVDSKAGNDGFLQISRRIYKNGDSVYLINDKSCRLKDIKELFLNTGIGVSAYSIIEQGQISQLLTASKLERRLIFEEAAGISKFKAQKVEATRKLEKTEQNLLRVADIVEEVSRRLRSVKMQAGKARNYVEYRDRLNELKMSYYLAEYDKFFRKAEKTKEKYQLVNDKYHELSAIISRDDALSANIKNDISQTETELNRSDNMLIAITGRIEQNLEKIEYLRKRSEELEHRKNTASQRISQLEEQILKLSANHSAIQFKIQQNKGSFDEHQQMFRSLSEMLNQAETGCMELEAQLEDAKNASFEVVRRSSQISNEINSSGTYRENLDAQKLNTSKRIENLSRQMKSMEEDRERLKKLIGENEGKESYLREQFETYNSKISEINAGVASKNEKLARLREEKSGCMSELAVLRKMENESEGLNSSLQEILSEKAEGKHPQICGIVAELIKAEPGYDRLVECVLSGMTDSLVVESFNDYLENRKKFIEMENSLKFICLDSLKPDETAEAVINSGLAVSRLSDHVTSEEKYAGLIKCLLGNTFITDSIENARKISNELPSGINLITMDSEMLINGCTVTTGPDTAGSGLISRKSRINEIESLTAELDAKIAEILKDIENSSDIKEQISAEMSEIQNQLFTVNNEKNELNTQLEVISSGISNLNTDLPSMQKELESISAQISESLEKEQSLKQELAKIDNSKNVNDEQISTLSERLEEQRAVRSEISNRLTDARVKLAQASVTSDNLKQQAVNYESQIRRSENSLESTRREMSGNDELVDETTRSILYAESSVTDLYYEKEKLQSAAMAVKEKLAGMHSELAEVQERLRERNSLHSDMAQQIHELDLSINELRIKTEDLITRTGEELQINLLESYQDYQSREIDWAAVTAEIKELKEKISRLGNVNLDAIDELEDLQKREDFLTEQVGDLTKSRNNLQQIIDKINVESREKFQETFNLVRDNFRSIFRKLFGGGKADIQLEEDVDILEAGIEIIAQPPGKGAKTISLLSGGEKTMTAIALQFAVFNIKPSPFCFLDEVDAALDEANNERFNLIVKEFEEFSQFIIITHAKRTMSIADELFGVTMQQQGVSKKISVKFEKDSEELSAA